MLKKLWSISDSNIYEKPSMAQMGIDSVEGFIYANGSKEETCVTVTSIYNTVMNRQIPVVASIMFGKTKEIYKMHFDFTFKHLCIHLKSKKNG